MNPSITLAVLPFQLRQEHRSMITQNFEEDLVYHLSKFQGLSILSFFSTSQWSIHDESNFLKYRVSHIITGSFRLIKDQMIINVQLIEFPQNRVIYDQRIGYDETEVFELLDQSVLQVTNLLQDQLRQSILSKSYHKPEVDLAAYELFIMGNAALKKGSPEEDLKARSMFEAALKKQPDYARAYAGISSSYFNQWSCQLWDRWEISQSGAKKYALKAIDLDENDYLSLCILGRVLLFERDFTQAEFYLRKSMEMNNNDSATLLEIAFSFMFLGHVEEAWQLYLRACQLNPMKEDKYLSVGATMAFEKGDFTRTLELGKQLEISNTYIDFPVYMSAAAYYLGNKSEAIRYWDFFLEKFKQHIYYHDKDKQEDPLSWHIKINPYAGTTQLSRFHEFIGQQSSIPKTKPNIKQTHRNAGRMSISGNQITLFFAEDVCVLNKSKGLMDIAALLENPGSQMHCMELMQAKIDHSSEISVIDDQSKKAYHQRLQDLQLAISEADRLNDTEQLQHLHEEYDQLVTHLSHALGLKGKSRKAGSTPEKARAAVTLRIRDSIKKIGHQHQLLGSHLNNSIKTGLLCTYQPESTISWEITYD
ncbi:MAG: hypothetical protein R8G66_20000 [Cytophagales bacterium]|nr:hypothetical protein [Cytophagales bacterium]